MNHAGTSVRQGPGIPKGGNARRRSFSVVLVLVCLLSLALQPAVRSAEGDDLLPALKVAYIYKFTGFIKWPGVSKERPFIIGVIGDPVMAGHLRVLERDGKLIDGWRIEVRAFPKPEAVTPCEILFVGGAAAKTLPAIVRGTAGRPTLLVGDAPGYAGRGIAIELFRKPDIFRRSERLRFRIDPKALHGRGLEVSAQLYDVAEVVE